MRTPVLSFSVNRLTSSTRGKVMVLRAEVRPPATLRVLTPIGRAAKWGSASDLETPP